MPVTLRRRDKKNDRISATTIRQSRIIKLYILPTRILAKLSPCEFSHREVSQLLRLCAYAPSSEERKKKHNKARALSHRENYPGVFAAKLQRTTNDIAHSKRYNRATSLPPASVRLYNQRKWRIKPRKKEAGSRRL